MGIISWILTLVKENGVRKKGAGSFVQSLLLFVIFSYDCILFQHTILDHVVITQQFFHYSALHYAKQRLLQCI
mgnify:FL=1